MRVSKKNASFPQKHEEVMHWRTSKCGRTKMFLLSSITQLSDENIVAHSTSKQLCICADYENPVSATMRYFFIKPNIPLIKFFRIFQLLRYRIFIFIFQLIEMMMWSFFVECRGVGSFGNKFK